MWENGARKVTRMEKESSMSPTTSSIMDTSIECPVDMGLSSSSARKSDMKVN